MQALAAAADMQVCAPRRDRCGAVATRWLKINAPGHLPPRICECCLRMYRTNIAEHYQPIPSDRMRTLGCNAVVQR